MRKLFLFSLVFVLTLSLGYGMAMAGQGNYAPSGPHYNLNLIGVEKGKKVDMVGSNRHTIFVRLGKNGETHTKIYLLEGDFQVCDGNGFDKAYDCDGLELRPAGAVFQLPANGCWLPDCVDPDLQVYEVWVRALGTPGGSGTITTCIEVGEEVYCSAENVMLQRTVPDDNPPKFKDVSKELTTIYADPDEDGNYGRYGLFHDELWQYYWDYDNHGLKLVQLRFYMLEDINKPGYTP